MLPSLTQAQRFTGPQAGARPEVSAQVFVEDFESGPGDWFADNGIWEIGEPSAGPDRAYSGKSVAGTVLGGTYPNNANSRLISPDIVLPGLNSGEELQLRLWHWFNIDRDDSVSIEVSVAGAPWESIGHEFSGVSSAWTQFLTLDVSAYAASTIRLAFLLIADGNNRGNHGWYIDDLTLEVISALLPFRNPENFEEGIGDWFASNGIWEVGIPTSGPDSAYSGQNVAGTVLAAVYPNNANSRLISPSIEFVPLPGASSRLRFWHWFNIDDNDYAVLQISANNGEWQDLTSPFKGRSSAWTQFIVTDISAYVGATIRLAFLLISDGNNRGNSGWYIDDLTIEGIEQTPTAVQTNDVPSFFELHGAYPNPFNPVTTIRFDLPVPADVTVRVFDILGREVWRVEAGRMPEGRYHEIRLDAGTLASGIYVYQVEIQLPGRKERKSGRLVLVR